MISEKILSNVMNHRRHLRHVRNILIVTALVFLAAALWFVDFWGFKSIRRVMVFTIYSSLVSAWCISVDRRIMHRNVRRYMICVALCMFFWLLVRSIKFNIFGIYPVANRVLWYCYYIPQVICCELMYRISLCIGKDEDYTIPPKYNIVSVISGTLLTMVLTNEFHEFVFEKETEGHKLGYFLIVIWMGILMLVSLGRIRKNSDRRAKRYLPYVVMVVAITWFVLYLIYPSRRGFGFIEFTVLFCSFTVIMFETLINTGMIPSNSCYEWCFKQSSLRTTILDNKANICFASPKAIAPDKAIVDSLKRGERVMINADTELSMSDINGGCVVWEKDVSLINQLIDEMEDARESIINATDILKTNIDVKAKIESLAAKNRLYDLVISNVNFQIEMMEQRLEMLQSYPDDDFVSIARRINVFGAYLKRKCNLVLISNEKNANLGAELELSFNEIFVHLNKFGIKGQALFKATPDITIDVALLLCDLTESAIEQGIMLYDEMTVYVSESSEGLRFTIYALFKVDLEMEQYLLESAYSGWRELISENFDGTLELECSEDSLSVSAFIPVAKEVRI